MGRRAWMLATLLATLLAGCCWPAKSGALTPPTADTETVEVVVAAREIPVGHALEVGDLALVPMPLSLVPEWSFLALEHVVGRVPVNPLAEHELVRASFLADLENRALGLGVVLPGQMRALYPPPPAWTPDGGTYVDLLWNPDGKGPCLASQALFVLLPAEREGGKAGHSLLVTDEEVVDVLPVAHHPSYRVVRRHDDDIDWVEGLACP